MKIAMIGHKYVPSREGGVEIVVEELSKRMARNGHEVTIFNRKRKDYPTISEYENCKIVNIFTINKKSLDAIVYSFFATLKVKKMIKKGLIDVVHFHAEGPCFFLNLLKRTAKKHNAKIIATVHGLDWKRGKWGGLASKVILSGEKKIVKYADEIIVLSKNDQEYFKNTYNKETFLIPNGIDDPIIRKPNIIKEKYGLKERDYVLFLSRIVPEKGLHYLIDAWHQLTKEEKHGKKLVIAGSSSHSDEYYEQMMKTIESDADIITTGFVEGDLLYELFSNAFLYVLPSDIEGMPMSLLEAISYNNQCLVSDIPEIVEIVNDSCYKFRNGDSKDLSEKLKYILSNDNISKINGINLLSWSEVVDLTLKIYKNKRGTQYEQKA